MDIGIRINPAAPSSQDAMNTRIRATIEATPVSSSGMDTTFVGPLSTLLQNPYAQQNLSYPRDLGSSQKAHSVVFRAFQIQPTDFKKLVNTISEKTGEASTALYNGVTAGIDSAVEFATLPADKQKAIIEAKSSEIITSTSNFLNQGVDAFGNKLTGAAKSAGTAASDTISSVNSTRATDYTKTPTGNANDTITLYMPDNAESNYGASYGKIGLLAAAASVPVLGAIPNAIQGILGNEAVKVAMQTMGYVFNPQEQVMFEGIDFRTFNMSFTLTPHSREESTQIRNIIQTFRKNAAPRIASGGVGFFFVPPSIFEVTFMYNGAENPNINKLKRCVLTDVNVNYAPNGTWSTHDDGSPVQTSLTLSFKEIELVDRTAVEAGY